jgi:hypothetical protein
MEHTFKEGVPFYTIEDLKPHLVRFLKSINEQYNEE